MERTRRDPVSSAFWAIAESGSTPDWNRIQTVIKECLYIDEWMLSEEVNSMNWIADTLQVGVELREIGGLNQLRVKVTVLDNFQDSDDGVFLASSLNHKALGGAYIYDREQNQIDFVTYTTLIVWWDFALFITSLRTTIGQCEMISRQGRIHQLNRCTSAARNHPDHGRREDVHPLFVMRLDDTTQINYLEGLYLSRLEAARVFELIAEECDWVEIQDSSDELPRRIIDSMDFGFQMFPPEDTLEVLNEFSAFVHVKFNDMSEFGRVISIDVGIPLFTWPGIFDDGANHEDAVYLANYLNLAAEEMCWQKLGLGCWYARGSQVCFSIDVPHTWLEPILLAIAPLNVAEFIFDLVNPNMLHRMFSAAMRELKGHGVKTQRDPQEMDMHHSIGHTRRRSEWVRCHVEDVHSEFDESPQWGIPSRPLLTYGIFNPAGSTLGSIELLFRPRETLLVNRFRHPFEDGEIFLCRLSNSTEETDEIKRAISDLADNVSLPDFLHIPPDCPEKLRQSVLDGIHQMTTRFLLSGVDLTLKASRIARQPNPWWRQGTSEPISESDDLSIVEGESPVQAYVRTASDPYIVDVNLALFHAWWAGAIAWLNQQDDPTIATQVVESLTNHVIARETGKVDQ